MIGDLVPKLEAYFADQADRVDQRLRRLAEGQAALMVNIHVQTKAVFPFGGDDLLPGSEDAGLRVVLNPHVLSAAESGWEAAADEFAIDAAFDVENPQVGRALSTASSERVRRINDATREALRGTLNQGADRGYSVYQMANGVDADGFPGIRSVVDESYRGRAETIARTEMAWGSNQGATALYASEGVTHVEVLDGMDWDEPCQTANGQTWTLARAEAEPLAHPNCQRAFAPVVEKPEGEAAEAGVGGPAAFADDLAGNPINSGSYGQIGQRSEEMGQRLRGQWGKNPEFVKLDRAARRFSSASNPIREASRAQMAGQAADVAVAAKDAAITLGQHVRNSPVLGRSTWRGMHFGPKTSMDDLVGAWRTGSTVDVPLSSSSFGKDVAKFFAQGKKRPPIKGKQVIMEFRESQGLPIGALSNNAHELEVLMGGRFEVVAANARGDILNVVLKQVASL